MKTGGAKNDWFYYRTVCRCIYRSCINVSMQMIERMENRDYVDKEHIIELEGHNAKIFFLKHSDSNALKQVEELLIDAYENRECKGFVS